MTNLKAISLFSGMGGDTLGLHNAGVEIITYTGCNKTYTENHKFNFPNCNCIWLDVWSDIRIITEEHLSEYVNNIDIIYFL